MGGWCQRLNQCARRKRDILGLPINTEIGILKQLYTWDSGIIEWVNDSKRKLRLLLINYQRWSDLFASCNYAFISQRDLERMSYPMPQPEFAGCFNLLEFFLAYKVMCHTIVNHSSKLGTIWADWYNYQFRLRVHGRCKMSMWSWNQVRNRGCRQLW